MNDQHQFGLKDRKAEGGSKRGRVGWGLTAGRVLTAGLPPITFSSSSYRAEPVVKGSRDEQKGSQIMWLSPV